MVFALVAIVLGACVCSSVPTFGIGDSGTGLRIRNDTGAAVTLVEVGQDSGRDLVSHLGVGQERATLWHFTTGSRITLRATSETSQLIYCHSFSYEELRGLDSLVSMTQGRLDC